MQKDVKRLEDMTLKELWELFPIRLVDPAPDRWKKSFNNEKKKLAAVLKERALSINHIGSTAVGTIKAKDIVDIMVETAAGKMKECAALLRDNGYIIMSESEERISLNKGYTPEGYADEVFHIHLRNKGDADEIYFCAYLKERPEVAKRYEELKTELLKSTERTGTVTRWRRVVSSKRSQKKQREKLRIPTVRRKAMFKIDKVVLRYIIESNYGKGEEQEKLFEDLTYSLDNLTHDFSDAISVCLGYGDDEGNCVALDVIGEIAERAEENAENAEIIYNTFMNIVDDARLFEVLAYYDKRFLPADKRKTAIKKAKELFIDEMTEGLDDTDND